MPQNLKRHEKNSNGRGEGQTRSYCKGAGTEGIKGRIRIEGYQHAQLWKILSESGSTEITGVFLAVRYPTDHNRRISRAYTAFKFALTRGFHTIF